MTERLREHRDDLSGLIDVTAGALRIPAAYVEKDFWVTEVLRVSTGDRTVPLAGGAVGTAAFVFKGGTSLSRVFGLIDRFSEDVDLLAVFPPDATMPARHKILKAVDADVSAHLNLSPADVRITSSTTGIKRYTTYPYLSDTPDRALAEGVVLELGTRGGSHPTSSHTYRSMVAEHAMAAFGDTETTWQEFAPFEVSVLAPERTLLEKLAAVHDAASRFETDADALPRLGRHFYDISCLLRSPGVRQALMALGSSGVRALAADIDEHSDEAGMSWTSRPESGYAQSPAFNRGHPARLTIANAFERARPLIHGPQQSLDECIATVHEYSMFL